MNPPDLESLERDLARLKPGRPPQALLDRLTAAPAQPALATPVPPRVRPTLPTIGWWRRLRLWTPITAAAVVVVWASLRRTDLPTPAAEPAATLPVRPLLLADGIEFGHQLVAAYDAVAELPGGEPVRFRCREWLDEVVLRDSSRGLVYEQRVPRLEVIPVRYETD